MKAALLAILLATTASGQVIDHERDVFIDHEGNVGPNLFASGPSDAELDLSMGEDAWQFLTPARKRILERYAKTCYRDFEGEIWTTWFSTQIKRQDEEYLGHNPLWWFNLNRQFGGNQYRPVTEDAEPISAKELLGAMINEEIKLVRFIRDKRETRGPVYQRVLVTTNGSKNYDGDYSIPEKQGPDDRGGLWIYQNRRVDSSEYEPIWTFREQRFPTEILERRVSRWREESDNDDYGERNSDGSVLAERDGGNEP